MNIEMAGTTNILLFLFCVFIIFVIISSGIIAEPIGSVEPKRLFINLIISIIISTIYTIFNHF